MTLAPNAPVLLTTKLRPPQRRGLIPRPRLVQRLNPAEHRLTVIDAPAGWGKTTLLSQWHQHCRQLLLADAAHIAWLTLDGDDNDPVLFWSYVVAAVAAAAPGIGDRSRSSLSAGGRALREAAHTGAGGRPRRAAGADVLVLDDYHVITERVVHETLTQLIGGMPAQTHLVLATRGTPPVGLDAGGAGTSWPTWRPGPGVPGRRGRTPARPRAGGTADPR